MDEKTKEHFVNKHAIDEGSQLVKCPKFIGEGFNVTASANVLSNERVIVKLMFVDV